MENIKPTIKKPVTSQSKNFENKFKNTMTHINNSITEVDELLNEKEQSLKKKIFSLPKMEALVFSDPKLMAKYDEMAENGAEKYGYHYNETIMNMLFNDYVLNSPKYLQKYKQSIPKQKKRRDKSGINQLKKSGGLETKEKDDKEKVEENVEGKTKVLFLINNNDPDNDEVFAYFPDDNHDVSGEYKTSYSHIGQHSACHPDYAKESRLATPEEYSDLKNELENQVGYELDILTSFDDINISETTTSGSVGGAGMGSGGYATPYAWGGGNLKKGTKKAKGVVKKPIWNGGRFIQESNYLLESNGFEKYYNNISESESLESVIEKAKQISRDEGVVQHVNKISDDIYNISDWYDDEITVISFENGMELNENNKMNEHHLNTRDEKINFILSKTTYDENRLQNYNDDKINKIYNIVEKKLGLTEKSESKAQQKFMGMVRGVQKGDINKNDVSDDITKAAKNMKPSDVKDFASTKHDNLPEKVSENIDSNEWVGVDVNLDTSLDEYGVVATQPKDKDYPDEWFVIYKINDDAFGSGWVRESEINKIGTQNDWSNDSNNTENFLSYVGMDANNWLNQPFINKLYDLISYWGYENIMGTDYSPMSKEEAFSKINNENNNTITEHHLTNNEDKINYIIKGFRMIEPEMEQSDAEKYFHNFLKNKAGDEFIDKIYNDVENDLKNMGIDPKSVDVNETDQSMIDSTQDTMAFKPEPVGNLGGNDMTMGMRDGGMNESDVKILKRVNEELELFDKFHNKMKKIMEDKKTSSLVNKERLGSENEKNFKSDIKHSGTKDTINIEKELQWKDQQKEVGKNPHKMSQDIEKESIKNTKGEALKNVGNSANKKGDEIPKRNLTNDEMDEVEKYRLGQQDIVYDNEPDQKFEDRMKKDMGDDLYNKRKEKMNFRSKAPMYNKDTQPVTNDSIDKTQYNKYESKWNKRDGLKETVINGRYLNDLNKRKIIGFKMGDVVIKESIDDNLYKIDFSGIGNAITSKGDINEGVNDVLSTHSFYTNGTAVYAIVNKKTINENVNDRNKSILSEEMNRINHLLNYKPNNYIETSTIKKNRGF